MAPLFSEVLLASTSPARRALMSSLGVTYRAVSPGVTEEVPPGISVVEAVALLARRKAHAVRASAPQALVIGADQLVSRDGEALQKPTDRADARRQLRSLLGRSHEICTGVCVLGPGYDQALVDIAKPTFVSLSDEELERYLDLEEWHGCAGSYRVEAAGQALFASLEGDRTSVQGLPMFALTRLLRQAGVPFFVSRP